MSNLRGQDMRLFDVEGQRLYLTAEERKRFISAAALEDREIRIYCHVLHFTGCRPSEGLQLTAERVHIDEGSIVFRTLKKRKLDSRGREKAPEYRAVPVPTQLIEEIDLVFDIRRRQRLRKGLKLEFWPVGREASWRWVKRVMKRARIEGPQATSKGLRHAFGIAMLSGPKPLPLPVLRDLMGHADTQTTEIYLQAVGEEKRALVMQAWD